MMPSPSQSTPLEAIEELPRELIKKLKDIWITTAEQVVATSATPGGLHSLAEHLEVSDDEASRLVAATRARLSPEVAAEMEVPADTSEFGLGAIEPRREADEDNG